MHSGHYHVTLKQIIEEKHRMADLYITMARKSVGDKSDLLMQLAAEERESETLLKNEYKTLFLCNPAPIQPEESKIAAVSELIRIEASGAAHFLHMCKSAPNKRISELLKSMTEKATNHGYLLLLIL